MSDVKLLPLSSLIYYRQMIDALGYSYHLWIVVGEATNICRQSPCQSQDFAVKLPRKLIDDLKATANGIAATWWMAAAGYWKEMERHDGYLWLLHASPFFWTKLFFGVHMQVCWPKVISGVTRMCALYRKLWHLGDFEPS